MDGRKDYLQKGLIICLLACVCNLLWGSATPGIKIGYQLFDITDFSSRILFAGCRFTLAGVLAVVIGSLLAGKPLVPKKESLPKILVLASVQTVLQYTFYYIGLSRTSGVRTAILIGSSNLFSILGATLIARYEPLTRKKLIGCLVGLSGVVLVSLGGSGLGEGSAIGDFCVLLAAMSYGASVVLLKKYSHEENPVTLSGYQFIIGGLAMVLVGAPLGGRLMPVRGAAWCLLVYLAFVSAVAYSLWGVLLSHNPVGRVSIFGFTSPIFGVVLSAIFLHEGAQILTFRIPISLLLVSLGIYLVNRADS